MTSLTPVDADLVRIRTADEGPVLKPLQVGQRFLLDGAVWEVLRVTSCSASVRRVKGHHVEIRDAGGAVVRSFDCGSGVVQISPYARVSIIAEAQP